MLAAFAEIARRAADDEISEQQAVEQANSISPKLGKLLGASYANGIATLGLLGSLVGLYLTYSNNKSSEVANETLLNAITEQTFVLKQIKESLSVPQKSGAKPTEGKPEKKFSAKKLGPEGTPKSSRRAQVNHARREALRIRREQFGGARHH
jgi:VIT1/CCC1 family predicted Fe2+/Mn2+ transporter